MNLQFWKGIMIVCVLLLLFLGASVAFVETDSATFVITVLAAIHLLAAMAIISSFFYFDWDPFDPFRPD
ncbi:hypothetical protein OB955_12405 [Halobacteria archaeon AArc-m2/3/4]|uniref:Transmembrane protein n=1 Tax=Natronoglomus mannanivorans TaxID=2979990 RepID=A0AAP2Z0U9_9EURY|nr:hypothetical protein [Halobacteria archaeon AArc-xg1-1]MCU4973539.1 hypothetical protein [Halobacteria archaeon AArc-m2/3/4]